MEIGQMHAVRISPDHSVKDTPPEMEQAYDGVNESIGSALYPICNYFESLYRTLNTSGSIPYALLGGTSQNSDTTLAVQTPWATSLIPRDKLSRVLQAVIGGNNAPRVNANSLRTLVKTDILYRMLGNLGMAGPDGKPMNILVTPGPSVEYNPAFTFKENLQVMGGDFTPYADRVLGLAQSLGIKRVIPAGYSRGAAVAAKMLEQAGNHGVEALGGILVEAPYKDQNALSFVRAYAQDWLPGTKPKNLTGGWEVDDPDLMAKINQSPNNEWQDNIYSNGNLIHNLVAGYGLSKSEGLLPNLVDITDSGTPVVLGYGNLSAVTSGLGEAIKQNDDIQELALKGLFRALPFEGPHGTGENIKAFAIIFAIGIMAVTEMIEQIRQ